MIKPLLTELQGSPLALAQGGFRELEALLYIASETKASDPYSPNDDTGNIAAVLQDSVLIIPVTGVMTKYSGWDYLGMDEVALQILQAEHDEKIVGTILLMNTYGGSTQSWIRMEEVLRARKKPVIAVVDGMCASAGVYVACFCDRILALNPTCKIGSIGVMAQMIDSSEAEQKAGFKVLEFYPPESKYKNKAEKDALDGDDKLLIEETLSPLARHFQETVRRQRPGLKEEEGVLEGKMYFAGDALNLGLIDGICTLPEALRTVADIADERDSILRSLNN